MNKEMKELQEAIKDIPPIEVPIKPKDSEWDIDIFYPPTKTGADFLKAIQMVDNLF